METVNPYFLHTLLEPITGLADDDDAVSVYRSVDPNDSVRMRAVIRQLIVPHANSLSYAVRERVKLAYRYYLSRDGSSFARVFNANLPPFDPPDDARLFFVWIWEECFPNEDSRLAGWRDYVENADINEPFRLAQK